jgi:type VI secretion system protein ImpA
MSLAIEELSQPISEELPSGENLEYDPNYLEVENLLRPRSGPAVGEKGGEQKAEPRDWKGIAKLAGKLREKTHDLRLQVYCTIAAVKTQSLEEFRDNLELLKNYLDRFWDSAYPELDPDDGNDPILRMNVLQMLNQHSLVPMALERISLIELERVGAFSYHDIRLAQGKESPDGKEEVTDLQLVKQAFASASAERLELLHSTISDCITAFSDMDLIWKEKTGEEQLPFKDTETIRVLQSLYATVGEFTPTAGDVQTQHDAEGDMSSESVPAPAATGAVNNRSDVIRVLDKVCDYYAANEPSSPIPLLLRRAQRLVEKSFMEILEDMVPDGVKQAKIVSGNEDGN